MCLSSYQPYSRSFHLAPSCLYRSFYILYAFFLLSSFRVENLSPARPCVCVCKYWMQFWVRLSLTVPLALYIYFYMGIILATTRCVTNSTVLYAFLEAFNTRRRLRSFICWFPVSTRGGLTYIIHIFFPLSFFKFMIPVSTKVGRTQRPLLSA